jgi:hypothetical protein
MEQLKTDQLERVNSVDAIEEILKGFDFDLIEKLYFNNLSFLNPQDRISAQYMLYLRYNDHSDKIPVEKKPLFAIRSSVLQTGFNIENLGQTYRVRTQ